jgi:endonuclease/exonuclease/phosphatase (EEP) superfamily protein YafD
VSATKPLGFWRGVLGAVALAYPVGLALLALALTLIGEQWWLTTAVLYLPRAPLLLPLPFLTVLALLARSRALLATQVAALLLVLFPLMGLRLSCARERNPDADRLTVLSLNVSQSLWGTQAVVTQLRSTGADVIVLQEVGPNDADVLEASFSGFRHRVGQFLLVSRYPIEEVVEPPKIKLGKTLRSPRFVRYRLATPGGPIYLYNVHPMSPRDALDHLRGAGLRQELASGRLLRFVTPPQVAANTRLRLAQLQAIADDARRLPYPVIIAGDTNLPHLSWALRDVLGDYQDGFDAAGNGFGYTYPVSRRSPWLRIDRILAGPRVRFVAFRVIDVPVSDHLAVIADVELGG